MVPTCSTSNVEKPDIIVKTDPLSLSEMYPCTHKEVAASSSPAEWDPEKVTSYPAHKAVDIAAETRKRGAGTPVKHTSNARPRARTRTEEWSGFQSDRVDGVSGGSSAVTSAQSSETSSRLILYTRSDRVPKCAPIFGERTDVKDVDRFRCRALKHVDLQPYGKWVGKDPVKVVEEE